MKLPSLRTKVLPAINARWHLRLATRLGSRVRVWGRPVLWVYGTLIIGDRVRLISTTAKVELGVEKGATLEIGDGTYINYGCSICATQRVSIGPRCNIGTHVTIIDNNFHRLEPELRLERPPSANITIGENVWLGTRVIVLPGVTIGDGSVIGAGSIVTRDIPPGVLAVGQPARVVRPLHPPKT